jgi:hypothetical protein
MPERKEILRFFIRFAVVYGLLLLPWPGGRAAYVRWFCGLGNAVYAREHSRLLVLFEPEPANSGRPLDVQLTLANRAQVLPDGKLRGRVIGLDARRIGWVPTALLAALVVATPLSWRRRGWALLAGMAAMHVFLVGVIAVTLLNNADGASGLDVFALTPFWKTIVDGLEETFVTQMGPGFVVATVIWISVLFLREDWSLLSSSHG